MGAGVGLGRSAVLQHFADEQTLDSAVLEDLFVVVLDLLRYLAFGVQPLQGFVDDLSDAEQRDREGFLIGACELSKSGLVSDEIADGMGWAYAEVRRACAKSSTSGTSSSSR